MLVTGFRVFGNSVLQYIVYLDEFGHIGPYVGRNEPKYQESPVFGLAGFIVPATRARSVASMFYHLKKTTLAWELQQTETPSYLWEKKGSSLFTLMNVNKYPEVRRAGKRLIKGICDNHGSVFYVGTQKHVGLNQFDSEQLYLSTLREVIKRIDEFCMTRTGFNQFILVLDEHQARESLITTASIEMFGKANQSRMTLSEPPFQVESHRFQTVQAADWIAGMVGRISAYRLCPHEYGDWNIFDKYFGQTLDEATIRSSIRPN